MFFLSGTVTTPDQSGIFHVSVQESAVSLGIPGSLYWRMVLETKIWALSVLVATRVSLFLDLFSRKNKEINVCVLIHAYRHSYKYYIEIN